jgi:type II secretory pathway component PulM
MRALRWLSEWLRARSHRERRFLAVGAIACVAMVVTARVILPLADHWREREAVLAANRDRLARLQALVSGEAEWREALSSRQRVERAEGDRLLGGPTPALAASNLQVLLQQYAEESLAELTRVDVAGPSATAGPGLLALPVVLEGRGDVYALVDFLARVQRGPSLLAIDELVVSGRSTESRDEILAWVLRAHGLYPTPVASR